MGEKGQQDQGALGWAIEEQRTGTGEHVLLC